jgi:hypothetical protein
MAKPNHSSFYRIPPICLMKLNHLFPLLGLTTIAVTTMAARPNAAIAVSFQVESGVTSVFLDVPLLQSVGLSLTGTADVAPPVNNNFLVGFNITPATDFTFSTEGGLVPLSGSIEHTGSVTFNDQVTVGNFSIGFDPTRTSSQASGFFVKDTLDDIGAILFDIATPEIANFDGKDLTLGANLLVSQEFASALGNANLTGTVVGKAEVDAEAAPVPEPASALAILGIGSAVTLANKRNLKGKEN